ncbi:MAG: ABC transporter permease, partial [Candidatus Acidiferrales bacterium]
MNKLMQDIRYGLRMLAKSPGFAAVAILTLALGIGANTAIFSLIDAVMLRSLPVENPSQLVLLNWTARHQPDVHEYMSSGDCGDNLGFGQKSAHNPSGCSFSEPLFRRIAKTNAFSGVAAFANSGRLDLTGNGAASVINGQVVSGDFFHTLGVKAAAGRVFEASDDSRSAAPVAMLNYGYWQSAFGGSRDVIGRTIELNNVPFTIVGVAEARFTGVTPGSDYDVWLPLSNEEKIDPRAQIRDRLGMAKRQDDVASWWLTIIGRLKPNTPVAPAQAIVSGVFRNEMLHGTVPMFHGGGPGGGPGRGPGGPAGGGMVRQQIVLGGRPGPGPGGNAPSGAAPPQMAPGKGPVEFRGSASGGQMPQPAGKKPLVMPGQPGAFPAGRMQGGQTANGPKTLSTAADNPEIT